MAGQVVPQFHTPAALAGMYVFTGGADPSSSFPYPPGATNTITSGTLLTDYADLGLAQLNFASARGIESMRVQVDIISIDVGGAATSLGVDTIVLAKDFKFLVTNCNYQELVQVDQAGQTKTDIVSGFGNNWSYKNPTPPPIQNIKPIADNAFILMGAAGIVSGLGSHANILPVAQSTPRTYTVSGQTVHDLWRLDLSFGLYINDGLNLTDGFVISDATAGSFFLELPVTLPAFTGQTSDVLTTVGVTQYPDGYVYAAAGVWSIIGSYSGPAGYIGHYFCTTDPHTFGVNPLPARAYNYTVTFNYLP